MQEDKLTLNTALDELINPRAHQTKKGFARLGLSTVRDLVEFLPFRLEDRTNLQPIAMLKFQVDSVIEGQITAVSSRRTLRGALLVQATIKDHSGSIQAIWFNQRYLLGYLKAGDQIMVFGSKQPLKSMKFPFAVKQIVEKVELCPVYHTTARLSQNVIRKAIKQALAELPKIEEVLPEEVRLSQRLPTRDDALRRSHLPTANGDVAIGQELLATEELFSLALLSEKQRQSRLIITRPALNIDAQRLKDFIKKLPFDLTSSQKKATWEIMKDLANSWPMNRILYGEVGSGKTIIALLIALVAIWKGKKVAFLCPTIALAKQQHKTALQILNGETEVGYSGSNEKISTDSPLLVGTHSLLGSGDEFDLVIIDEQHRFGVEQRQAVAKKITTDILMMTATPIPRTLAATIFRQLEITYLTERPAHQLPVKTVSFLQSERNKIEEKIKLLLSAGEPGYVICPRIHETSEQDDQLFLDEKKSVNSEVRRLRTAFPEVNIKAIHSQVSAKELGEVLDQFKDGRVHILVATTVVEVGIDNPKATWILIEQSDLFGLSTLHQLRGRVGRGDRQSYCFVSNTSNDEKSEQRLRAFCQITNGLELAEADLALRGPGDIIGTDQSGQSFLRYAQWSDTDKIRELFILAAKYAQET